MEITGKYRSYTIGQMGMNQATDSYGRNKNQIQ